MSGKKGSRRGFLGAAVAAPALGAMALADPGRAAAQAAGVKRGDLPDLTIKQVKVLVLKPEERRAPAGAPGVPSGPGGARRRRPRWRLCRPARRAHRGETRLHRHQ